jgi:hypothetical protein
VWAVWREKVEGDLRFQADAVRTEDGSAYSLGHWGVRGVRHRREWSASRSPHRGAASYKTPHLRSQSAILLDLFRASLAPRRVPVRHGLEAGHEGGFGWSMVVPGMIRRRVFNTVDSEEDRYFLCMILGGRLLPKGIPQWGPWNSSRLHWWTEDHLTLLRDRKAGTAEELVAVTKEPRGVAPAQTVWIHKGLEDEARRL